MNSIESHFIFSTVYLHTFAWSDPENNYSPSWDSFTISSVGVLVDGVALIITEISIYQ